MTKQDAVKSWYLKKIDFFNKRNEEIIERFDNVSHFRDIEEGEKLYFPGEPSEYVYLLKQGRVRLSRPGQEGRKVTTAVLETGDIFGMMAIEGGSERSTRAEALTGAFVCQVDRENFVEVMKDFPRFHLEITKQIGERKERIEGRIQNLIFRDARERLAYILGDLFRNHRMDGHDGAVPSIDFTHQEIADLAGLTRPTTSTLLNELENDGVIELERGRITLLDRRRLSGYAGE